VVVSKTQLYPPEAEHEALAFVGRHIAPYLEENQNPMIVSRDWDTFSDEDFAAFDGCGYHRVTHDRKKLDHSRLFGTYMDMVTCRSEDALREKVAGLFSDALCGHVLRIKGYASDEAGTWYEVNATRDIHQIRPVSIRRGLLIVIGQDLNEAELKEALM